MSIRLKLLLSGTVGHHSGASSTYDLDTTKTIADIETEIITNWTDIFPSCPVMYNASEFNLHLLKNGSVMNKERCLSEFQPTEGSFIHVVILKKLSKKGKLSSAGAGGKSEDDKSSKRCCAVS